MKKTILKLFIFFLLLANICFAEDCIKTLPDQPNIKIYKQIDKKIETRLNLTDSQIKYLKSNREKNLKELQKIVSKMENLHIKIRNIYLSGIPKFQADIKSAPYKMELVILKQDADKIRTQNRKNFESILTPEQKVEFVNLKKELHYKKCTFENSSK